MALAALLFAALAAAAAAAAGAVEKAPKGYVLDYSVSLCLTQTAGADQPGQRYYHVPPDWIKPTGNVLLLTERADR